MRHIDLPVLLDRARLNLSRLLLRSRPAGESIRYRSTAHLQLHQVSQTREGLDPRLWVQSPDL